MHPTARASGFSHLMATNLTCSDPDCGLPALLTELNKPAPMCAIHAAKLSVDVVTGIKQFVSYLVPRAEFSDYLRKTGRA